MNNVEPERQPRRQRPISPMLALAAAATVATPVAIVGHDWQMAVCVLLGVLRALTGQSTDEQGRPDKDR